MGGADNLLNLLPVSVKPWIKALVNRSDVVTVREADSQDTLQLNCWCLPSREEETTRYVYIARVRSERTNTQIHARRHAHTCLESKSDGKDRVILNSVCEFSYKEAGRAERIENVKRTVHLSWSIKDTEIFKQSHTASRITLLPYCLWMNWKI